MYELLSLVELKRAESGRSQVRSAVRKLKIAIYSRKKIEYHLTSSNHGRALILIEPNQGKIDTTKE